jgi:hypothetical protein
MSTPTEEIVTGEIVPYVPGSVVEEYRPRIVMDPEEAKEIDGQLRANMLAVLREDVDYGKIPGAGDKNNLLKPGAEKLLQWFGFGAESSEVKTEREDPDYPSGIADKARRIGVTYRTEVTKTVPGVGKVVVATCEGYAGYDEDRYFATMEDARAKAEARERANAARYKRPVNSAKWEYITADYRAPWNTLIKMAQKRAYVGAAIDATGAAGLFTQDMEDIVAEKVAPAALAEAGRAAIAALPAQVGAELDAWYTALRWPDPGTWDAEQWCKALVKAGEYSAEATFAKAGVTLQPAPEGKPARQEAAQKPPEPSQEDDEWTTKAFVDAGEYATPKDGEKLWADIVSRHAEGRIADDDKNRLSRIVQDRLRELRREQQEAA